MKRIRRRPFRERVLEGLHQVVMDTTKTPAGTPRAPGEPSAFSVLRQLPPAQYPQSGDAQSQGQLVQQQQQQQQQRDQPAPLVPQTSQGPGMGQVKAAGASWALAESFRNASKGVRSGNQTSGGGHGFDPSVYFAEGSIAAQAHDARYGVHELRAFGGIVLG